MISTETDMDTQANAAVLDPLVDPEGQSERDGMTFDPEPGWATQNPDRAMAFLYVSPRLGPIVDELLAL
jgi:hypothetical protein